MVLIVVLRFASFPWGLTGNQRGVISRIQVTTPDLMRLPGPGPGQDSGFLSAGFCPRLMTRTQKEYASLPSCSLARLLLLSAALSPSSLQAPPVTQRQSIPLYLFPQISNQSNQRGAWKATSASAGSVTFSRVVSPPLLQRPSSPRSGHWVPSLHCREPRTQARHPSLSHSGGRCTVFMHRQSALARTCRGYVRDALSRLQGPWQTSGGGGALGLG